VQLYENKDRMAKILNYAVDHKMSQFAEELTNIYSSQDWYTYYLIFKNENITITDLNTYH